MVTTVLAARGDLVLKPGDSMEATIMRRFSLKYLRAVFFLLTFLALILAVGAPEILPW